METKTWKMLGEHPPTFALRPRTDHKPTENNPKVINALATKLGLSPTLEFHDVYSLDSQAEFAHIPRPALALLVIIPLTTSWAQNRETEDADKGPYTGCGAGEPVTWFKQTIGHACGSIGLLHSVINGPAIDFITPDSDLDRIRQVAIPLKMDKRAEMLYNNTAFEAAHKSVEQQGDSYTDEEVTREGGHFVSFVKSGGKLWELEGNRKGPLHRGALEEDEDVLSPRALEMGIKRIIEMSKGEEGEDLLFSCIALARKAE
jgi:ubiquitin carboxyl-terminal hydrolase L3